MLLRRSHHLLALWLLSTGTAFANDNLTLETVVVTATRVAVNGSELPMTWSRVDAEDITFTAAQHNQQLFQRVPGAWVSRGNGQESLVALRSPVLTGAGSCGALITAEDGISLRAPGFCNVNQLFDANIAQAGSVEAIMGPGAAVFGSNALHGVINVTTRNAQQTGQYLSTELGARDYYRTSIGLSNQIWAVNASTTSYGGYQDQSGFREQKLTLRSDTQTDDWSLSGAVSASLLDQETAGYIQGDNAYRQGDLRTTNPNPEAFRDAWSARAWLRAERAVTEDSVLTLTPYLRTNGMLFLQHFLPWKASERNAHRSVGLQAQLASSDVTTRWAVGLDVDATEGSLLEFQADDFSANQPAGIHYDYDVDATSMALFAHRSQALSESVRTEGALRFEQTRYRYQTNVTEGSACSPSATACRFYRPANRSDRFNDWSGSLAIVKDLTHTQWYARLARGFRAPQTTELYRLQAGQSVAEIDSERIDSAEIGVRISPNEQFSGSISAYAMRKTNVIFQDRDRFNVSGARTGHTGVEYDFAWQAHQDWSFSISGTLAEHRYTSEIELLGSNASLKDNLLDTAPRHFGRVSAEFNGQWLNRPLRSALEWNWMGAYFVDPENAHQYNGHQLLNWRSSWSLNDDLTLSLVATNLLDRAYAERADFGFGNYRYFVGEPRSLVLGVRWQNDP